MSARYCADVLAYLRAGQEATPRALRDLIATTEATHARRLPPEETLETLRPPMHRLVRPEQVFDVPAPDLHYVCLLTGTDVVPAEELRDRYFATLTDPAPGDRVWLLINGISHGCRCLVHLRRDGPDAYRLIHLFVAADDALAADAAVARLHESVLMRLWAYVDARDAEVRVAAAAAATLPPLARLTLGVSGFLRARGAAGGGLVRPPLPQTCASEALRGAVWASVAGAVAAQRARLAAAPPLSPGGGSPRAGSRSPPRRPRTAAASPP